MTVRNRVWAVGGLFAGLAVLFWWALANDDGPGQRQNLERTPSEVCRPLEANAENLDEQRRILSKLDELSREIELLKIPPVEDSSDAVERSLEPQPDNEKQENGEQRIYFRAKSDFYQEQLHREQRDSNWALEKEDEVRAFLDSSELRNRVELHSVMCQSTMCQAQLTMRDDQAFKELAVALSKPPFGGNTKVFPPDPDNYLEVELYFAREQHKLPRFLFK